MELPEGLCEAIPLNGWRWSEKLELFNSGIPGDRILYLDLDTRIRSNIDNLLTLEQDFLALRPWAGERKKNPLCLSGMMAWRNDGTYSFLKDEFTLETIPKYPQGDREYFTRKLSEHGKMMTFFQDVINGMYSWRQCSNGHTPHEARIICYHGHPMPLEEE